MSETEPFRLRWIIECLGVNRTGSLLFVGQIPDEIYSHSKAEGIACYQVDTIEQAAAQFAQPHSGGESNHDDLLTLVPQHDLSEPGCWFEYRMSQYKPAPEWLNARYWANPERFEVQEDPDGFCESSDDEEE